MTVNIGSLYVRKGNDVYPSSDRCVLGSEQVDGVTLSSPTPSDDERSSILKRRFGYLLLVGILRGAVSDARAFRHLAPLAFEHEARLE